jgi:hypothetical protein
MFFAGLSFAQTVLAPLVTLLVTTMLATFFSTGGVMYSVFSGASSFYLVIPSLAVIYPLSIGQPWIGLGMAIAFSWVAVFFWSWIDPTKRSIVVAKLYALLLLLMSFQAPTAKAAWTMLANIAIYWSILSGFCLVALWLSDPLCILMSQHISVALYNLGVICDAVTQPLLSHARSEALPHFLVEHPMPSLANLRAQQLKHNEQMAIYMRELPMEASFAETESTLNSTLFASYLVVNDCMTSIAAFASRGIAYNLYSPHWKILAPFMDEYTGCVREYISQINQALISMYTGNGHIPDFQKIRDECNAARKALFNAYVKEIKKNGPTIPGTDATSSANIDHWIFMFMQLWKALNGLAHEVDIAARATTANGWGWRILYFTKASFMPIVLMIISTIYLIRCGLKIASLPFVALFRRCCGKSQTTQNATTSAPTNAPASQASTNPTDVHSSDSSEEASDALRKNTALNASSSAAAPRSAVAGSRESAKRDDLNASTTSMGRESIVVEMPSLYAGPSLPDASSSLKSEKKFNQMWHKSLTLTTPPKIRIDEYIRDGRYKFPIRFICVVTPVAVLSVAVLLYWLKTIQTPWAISSCIIVMMATTGATWRRFMHRAFGTLLGALLGQITVIVCFSTHKYVCWGPLIIMVLVTTYFHLSKEGRYSYFYLITSLTYGIIVVSAYPFNAPSNLKWTNASYRFLLVILGSLVGSLGSFILPERSIDRYLNVLRAIVAGANKVVKHIHTALSEQKQPDKTFLLGCANEMTAFQSAAIAHRYDAAAEMFYMKHLAEGLRTLRYKARDMCYSTRMQVYSALTGFGSNDAFTPFTVDFISQADTVHKNISYEVQYITANLDRKSDHSLLLLSTEQARADFLELEEHCQPIKNKLSQRECLQMSSHITLFRLFCVLLHDISRTTEHYF